MKKFLALMLVVMMVVAFAACNNNNGGDTPSNTTAPAANTDTPSGGSELAGEYTITVWVADAAVELTKKQIENFNNTNTDGIKFNASVQPVSEANAATDMITDVSAGGDIFCFAQDQFARLVQAGALAKLGVQAAENVTAANDAGAVKAATIGTDMYAYPLTADNGYFMYYDKSVVPESDVDSLEKIIADCEAAGKYFAMETNTSAWYIASFFFGAGCVSEWKVDNDGNYESINDDFNSDKGLIAVKGMKKLVDSQYYVSSSKGAEFDSGAAVVVTGTWDYEVIKGILGDNLGAADLPSFEVDGQQYHMGSYNGCKLLGVKPQSDAKKAAALNKLAQYLTGEDCQKERFAELAWGPSNKNAQADPAVQANPALVALAAQAPYSVPQGQIHGSWWDIAKVIGDDVKAATDEAGLRAALQNYADKISAIFNMSEDDKNAWSVIGGICGTAWDTDFPMAKTAEGVYQSNPLELHAGEELKCRQGASWDVNYGADGENGANVVVEADGTYIVELNLNEGTITLVPAN